VHDARLAAFVTFAFKDFAISGAGSLRPHKSAQSLFSPNCRSERARRIFFDGP
jgi:hypothetical protein